MKDTVIDIAKKLRLKGDYQYVLANYVKSEALINKLKIVFENNYIEDFTDFNYSVCFTININISDTDSAPGEKKFYEYLEKNKYLHRIQIQICAIAPYALYRFVRYNYNGGNIKMEISSNPFIKEHIIYGRIAEKFLIESKLTILDEDILSATIPDVTLEMKESDVTVYNCLFEDEY